MNQRIVCLCHTVSPCVALYCSNSNSQCIIFHTSGLNCEQMVQWFVIDWSFLQGYGSSLSKTISKVTRLMSSADGTVCLVSLNWLPALGHREAADGPGGCA